MRLDILHAFPIQLTDDLSVFQFDAIPRIFKKLSIQINSRFFSSYHMILNIILYPSEPMNSDCKCE